MPNHIFFENNALLLKSRVLQLKGQNIVVALSKNQALLIYCLMNKINEKALLIEYIWPKQNHDLMEARYNQLIFKTRRALNDNGFPSDFILTLKGFGLCLNSDFFDMEEKSFDRDVYMRTQPFIL